MRRTPLALSRTQGAGSNHNNLPWHEVEPPGYGIGRSRGGLTTKIHQAVDGHGRPLAMIVTGGQRNDGAMLTDVLAEIHVPRAGPGRPRTRPDAVIADRAHATGVIRTELRRRGIKTVIPGKRDQAAARKRHGSRGGQPPGLDAAAYKGRTVVERFFALAKQWRGIATRYDKLATNTARGQLADLEVRHRRRARCEDRIRGARTPDCGIIPARIRPEPDLVRTGHPRL